MEGSVLASIILSILTLTTSIIAIVISILSYKKDNKHSNTQTALGLYDLRLKVYKFYCDCMDTLGGLIWLTSSKNLPFNFQSLLNIFNENAAEEPVKLTRNKLLKAQNDDKDNFYLITVLFDKTLNKKLLEIFNCYSEIYTAILANQKTTSREAEIALKTLVNYSNDKSIKEQLSVFLDFSSYKIPNKKKT